jgi:hypothetical protein
MAWAMPHAKSSSDRNDNCLSQDDTNQILGDFIAVLGHTDIDAANETAQVLLADGFVEISDSVLALRGRPVNQIHLTFKADLAHSSMVTLSQASRSISTAC